MTKTKTRIADAAIDVHGDLLSVDWDGNCWVSRCNGQQHSREWDALAAELQDHLSACGEDTDHIDGQHVLDHYDVLLNHPVPDD